LSFEMTVAATAAINDTHVALRSVPLHATQRCR
jgi:hypothetical protein